MDEDEVAQVETVGQRLRAAREAKGLSVEDIAASTRIPTRHLTALENSEWDRLPAATYSIGFAKNYANAVDLPRDEIGDQLRAEMGGVRPQTMAYPEVYETADPARTMPKGLVFGALILLAALVGGLLWMRSSSLEPDAVPVEDNAAVANEVVAEAPAPVGNGPVLLTANAPVWLEIKDGGAILKQGEMATGERYEVPANAVAPVLTTGKPEALQIMVGQVAAPAIGAPGKRVSNVSLKGDDLLKAGAAPTPIATAPASTAAPAATAPTRPRATVRPRASAPAATTTTAPAAEPAAATPPTTEPAPSGQ